MYIVALQALRLLISRYIPLAWLRRLLLWFAPLIRRWYSNYLPPQHCQLLSVYLHGDGFVRDGALTAQWQRKWNANAEPFDVELDEPVLVVWRAHGQRYATYFVSSVHFPPSLARPRGATLLGGPRNDNYRGTAWETPSWLAEQTLFLQNTPN